MSDLIDNQVAKFKILVVDDNAEMCAMLRNMLKDFGLMRIFTSKDGTEAMEVLNDAVDNQPFDVILCDWNMPGITGIELLRQIRSCDPDLPFIMITGNADKASVKEALDHDITDYIVKPFAPATLQKKLRVVARMLSQRERPSEAAD